MTIKDCVTLNNGVKMPLLGLGVYLADNDNVVESVKWAVNAGYRHIDTAAIYENEKGVGRAIAECGVKREELFVTSKVWNSMQGYDTTLAAFDTTMDDLGLEYLDLYLIHWPMPRIDKYIDTYKALEKLYKDKRVRAIGISNFYEPWIKRVLDECEVVPAVNQVEFHPYIQHKELREYCKSKNIAFESYSTLARGAVMKDETLIQIAEKYGKSVAQLVLRFALQLDIIVIPKSVHEDRIISNADVFDFEISAEDMKTIEGLDRNEIICGADPHTFELM